jgi:hypothetical protein
MSGDISDAIWATNLLAGQGISLFKRREKRVGQRVEADLPKLAWKLRTRRGEDVRPEQRCASPVSHRSHELLGRGVFIPDLENLSKHAFGTLGTCLRDFVPGKRKPGGPAILEARPERIALTHELAETDGPDEQIVSLLHELIYLVGLVRSQVHFHRGSREDRAHAMVNKKTIQIEAAGDCSY